jgi:hypothetical protein
MRSAVKCIAKIHGSVVEIVKMLRECHLGVEPNVFKHEPLFTTRYPSIFCIAIETAPFVCASIPLANCQWA